MKNIFGAYCVGLASLALVACGNKGEDHASDGASIEAPTYRVAMYNVSLYEQEQGALKARLLAGDDAQAKALAEIIKRVDPDILVLGEIDFDPRAETLTAFRDTYLSPDSYPHILAIPSNTGVSSGVDLDNNGDIGSEIGSRTYGNDAYGYGVYPGQYAFAILSKHPIERSNIRSFQKFKWRDMPGNLMPTEFYTEEAQAVMRLSSKSHVDLPISIEGKTLHILAAHPTPPVFDGPEDRNGKRNHDEIRLLADYITPEKGDYIKDDQGRSGFLGAEKRFVVMGDLNADPLDGDSLNNPMRLLLDSPLIQDPAPGSLGAQAASMRQAGVNVSHNLPSRHDTADFADTGDRATGNLRLDYVLPSTYGLKVKSSGVFWPEEEDPNFALVGDGYPIISSDHRLVWVDLNLE